MCCNAYVFSCTILTSLVKLQVREIFPKAGTTYFILFKRSNLFLLNLAILFPDSHELTPPISFYLISLIYFYLINPSYLCLVTQSCLTLCNPMDNTAHQALLPMQFSRQEYWSGYSCTSRGSSQPRDHTQISLTAGRIFTI